MNAMTAYAIVWISCAIIISTGIYVMHSFMPLWILIIPAFMEVSSSK